MKTTQRILSNGEHYGNQANFETQNLNWIDEAFFGKKLIKRLLPHQRIGNVLDFFI